MPNTYIIAEIGSGHCTNLITALDLIQAAKRAGADAVKFQLFSPTGLAHPTHPSQEALRKYALPREWMPTLMQVAKHVGIDCSATPCDNAAVDLLHTLDVPFIKIASGDLTYHSLIRRSAQTGRHVILSTGMATMEEVEAAVQVVTAYHDNLTLLHCVGAYPVEHTDTNLGAMDDLRRIWPKVGFSDHSTSTILPAHAAAAGATVIEKHITLDYTTETPDSPHSLNPMQFAEMVRNIRWVEAAMGDGRKRVMPVEAPLRTAARRGLYYARDLPAGYVLSEADLVAVRPTAYMEPYEAGLVVGRPLIEPVRQWDAVRAEDVA